MSKAANPNKPKKTQLEIEADIAVKKQDADRERIRRCIITLGDEHRKVVAQIRAAVAAVQDDVELHGELITTTVLDCAKCLPTKLGIYGAWCAKMAEKHPKWAVGMVNKTMEDLRASVQAGHLIATQLLLRFMVFLANTGVLGVLAVVDLLLEVFALSKGLKSNEGGDFGAFAALAQLPFFTSAAYNLAKEKIQKLIAAGEEHVSARDAVWKATLRIFKSQESLDRLEELLHAVKQLSQGSWSVEVVLHVPGFSASSSGLPDMPAIPLALPEAFGRGVKLQVPLMSAQLLTAKGDGRMMPADRWVVEDYILLVVEMFAQDVQECSKQILRIPVLHPDFESIAVETLFSELLRLPSARFLPLFYCRLLEACAEKQNSMVKLIEDAFQSLFQKLSEMDDQCLDQLAEIFACHLANTAYKADWKIFTEDANAVSPATQHFARRTLDCLQQLSDYQNMLARLPQAMCSYAPAEPLPVSGLPVVSKPQFGRLINLVRLKDANVERVLRYCHWLMQQDLDNGTANGDANGNSAGAEESQGDGQPAAKRQKLSITDAEDFGEAPAEPLKLEEVAGLVMSVMLQQGHKTPTHMAKILDGHEQLLLKLKPANGADSSSFEQVLVKSVFDFWKASGLRLEITLDSLIQRNVISPAAVAEYALSHDLGHSNHWNVVKQVARKSLERSHRCCSDLAVAKKLGKEDVLEKCQAQVDSAAEANERLFRIIFISMVRSYRDAKDVNLRGTLLSRILSLSRRHLPDIKPLVDSAESQIPLVKGDPDIAAVFRLVSTLA